MPPSIRTFPRLSRCLFTTASSRYQHILYFGDVLGYTSPQRLSKFPRAWLDSVGVSSDVDHGLRWTGASGSPSHALLSYTLLDKPIDPRAPRGSTEELATSSFNTHTEESEGEEGEQGEVLEDEDGRRATSSHPSKVFSLGRNTYAQLGLGFSSQEATRGMVTGEMEGTGGISKVAAGSGFSFVVTSEGSSSRIFGFGNDSLGQLGSSPTTTTSNSLDPYDISTRHPDSDLPQLRLLPLPRPIALGAESGWTIKDVAVGIDHSLVLVERTLAGYKVQSVLSTGLNTDGQLGLTEPSKKDGVPIEPLLSRTFQPVPGLGSTTKEGESGGIVTVICGADTSYALTVGGDLWVWGNSEYGQSFAGVHDRLACPTFVSNPLVIAYAAQGIDSSSAPRIRKVVAGGSFAAILDNHGRVWVTGYGPRGVEPSGDAKEWEKLALVGFPEDVVVEDLFCGLEYIIAITRKTGGELGVWIWGIPPKSISTLPITHPTPIPFSIPKTPRQQWLDENPSRKKDLKTEEEKEEKAEVSVRVEAAACTRDHLLLVINDGIGKDVWAECVQPPRAKGTDVTV